MKPLSRELDRWMKATPMPFPLLALCCRAGMALQLLERSDARAAFVDTLVRADLLAFVEAWNAHHVAQHSWRNNGDGHGRQADPILRADGPGIAGRPEDADAANLEATPPADDIL